MHTSVFTVQDVLWGLNISAYVYNNLCMCKQGSLLKRLMSSMGQCMQIIKINGLS